MDELHPIPFFYRKGFEILTIDESAVDLNYHRWIVLFTFVQQVLDRQFAIDKVFGKTVKYESQFTSLGVITQSEIIFENRYTCVQFAGTEAGGYQFAKIGLPSGTL